MLLQNYYSSTPHNAIAIEVCLRASQTAPQYKMADKDGYGDGSISLLDEIFLRITNNPTPYRS
jgi:hypothetical protein